MITADKISAEISGKTAKVKGGETTFKIKCAGYSIENKQPIINVYFDKSETENIAVFSRNGDNVFMEYEAFKLTFDVL